MMKKQLYNILCALCLCVLAMGTLAAPAFAALPKDHAQYMESSEDYKNAFEQFTEGMREAKERLSAGEYKDLERENETTVAEIVKESLEAKDPEADAYATAYWMRNAYVNKALVWDWLRKNANGVQGFYRMQSAAFNGYMTIQEGEGKGLYAVYIFAVQKGGAENNCELKAEGKLNKKKMRLNYGGDDPSATVDLAFDGESARVTTSGAFKASGWFGANVVIDAEYIREKK
jgi:hypothetical protein